VASTVKKLHFLQKIFLDFNYYAPPPDFSTPGYFNAKVYPQPPTAEADADYPYYWRWVGGWYIPFQFKKSVTV